MVFENHEPVWKSHLLDHASTKRFSCLVLDYLNGSEELRSFYQGELNWASFEKQMELKSNFPHNNRQVLRQVLLEQYEELGSSSLNKQIDSLESSKTFTVTTGQQLVLFSGPLYVIYKAVHVIILANELKKKFPDCQFIPIFWLATEDHDFEEVNHVDILDHRIKTEREGEGAVGRTKLPDLKEEIKSLEKLIGHGKIQTRIIDCVKDAYGQAGISWSLATRRFLNSLLGEYGLVQLDADDARLKELSLDVFQDELTDSKAAKNAIQTSKYLDLKFKVQAFPRDINLFYLDEKRRRILKDQDTWRVDGGEEQWNKEALLQELKKHPERFSPNVLLRPVYQEKILPNLAYIGGGAEVAYWMQLKDVFQAFELPMPIVVPRQSVQFINAVQNQKRKRAGLEILELFEDSQKLVKDHVHKQTDFDLSLSVYQERIMQNFNELYEIARQTDKSMIGAVEAQRSKQLKGIENLKKKLLRAEKRRFSNEVKRIEVLLDELFPNAGLQERRMNWIEAELMVGGGLIPKLLEVVEPLGRKFALVELMD
jgi:bacillithiol biosynthesis cysteine-adding enzyme BshC